MNKHAPEFEVDGYVIQELYSENEMETLRQALCQRMGDIFSSIAPDRSFDFPDLESYHLCRDLDDELQGSLRDLSLRKLSLDQLLMDTIVNSGMKKCLTDLFGDTAMTVGRGYESGFESDCCGFRVIRPHPFRDPAPRIHAEVMANEGFNTGCELTVWIPLSGYDSRYTLKVLPRSHVVDHDEKYFVQTGDPAANFFSKEYTDRFRPDLKPGQAILIHPNVLHGAGENDGDITRSSLEVRFFNRQMIVH